MLFLSKDEEGICALLTLEGRILTFLTKQQQKIIVDRGVIL